MLDTLVTSKTRLKLILYLILSPSEAGAHLGDGKRAMLIWKKEL
ncbi:MAG: hypothetical protein Q7T72_07150 [Bacteroidales bacterium]|nr:hypothetical protein [Bacteroidales bacterium]